MEEAQPPEADHQSPRRVKVGISRYKPPSWFGRLSSQAQGVSITRRRSLKSGTVASSPVASEVFGLWVFIHASGKIEEGDCSADVMELKTHRAVINLLRNRMRTAMPDQSYFKVRK